MSLVELCDRRLGTEIRAAVDDDIHVTANLVSTQHCKRKLGYKPAPFTGGCLEVDVVFSFPVSISAVSFSTSSAKACQVQVRVANKIPGTNQPQFSGTNRHRDFQLAATTTLSPSQPRAVLFTYKHPDRITRDYPLFNPASSESPVPLFARHIITSCQCLRITVNTFGAERWLSALSIIGGLGILHRSYLEREKVTRKEVICRIQSVRQQQLKPATEIQSGTAAPVPPKQSSSTPNVEETENNTDIQPPPEFLDSITDQLMKFPMILPSGNVVDNSTLERHSAEEVTWGREPSDPFTGLVFTHTHRAVHHTSLKLRIEEWGRETGAGSGRCVGVGNGHVPLSTVLLSHDRDGVYTNNSKEKVVSSRLKRFLPGTKDQHSPKRIKTTNKNQTSPDENSSGSSKKHQEDSRSEEQIIEISDSDPVNNQPKCEVIEVLDDSNSSGFDLQRRLEQLSRHEDRLNDF